MIYITQKNLLIYGLELDVRIATTICKLVRKRAIRDDRLKAIKPKGEAKNHCKISPAYDECCHWHFTAPFTGGAALFFSLSLWFYSDTIINRGLI